MHEDVQIYHNLEEIIKNRVVWVDYSHMAKYLTYILVFVCITKWSGRAVIWKLFSSTTNFFVRKRKKEEKETYFFEPIEANGPWNFRKPLNNSGF